MLDQVSLAAGPALPAGGPGLERRAAINTISQLTPSAVRTGLGLVLAVLLARSLSVAGLGRYSVMIACVGLFNGVFNDWGLGTIVIRELSGDAGRRSEALSGAAALQVVVSAASYALLLVGTVVLIGPARDLSWGVAVFGASLLLGPLTILSLPVNAELRMASFVAPSVLAAVANFLLVGAAALLHAPLLWLAAATLVPTAAQTAWMARLGLRSVGRLAPPSRREWPRFVRASWPIGAAATLAVAWQQAPVLLLGLTSVHEAGVYAAASRLAMPVLAIPIAIAATAFPILSGQWARDRAGYRRTLEGTTSALLVIVVPVALAAVALTPTAVSVMYGAAYAASSAPLRAMIASTALLFPLILLTQAANAAGRQRSNLACLCVSTAAALLLLLVLAARLGAAGAAIALCAGYALYTLLVVLAASRAGLLGPRPASILAPPLAAAAAGAAALAALAPLGPAVQAPGAAAAALGAGWLLGPATTRRSLAAALTLGGLLRRCPSPHLPACARSWSAPPGGSRAITSTGRPRRRRSRGCAWATTTSSRPRRPSPSSAGPRSSPTSAWSRCTGRSRTWSGTACRARSWSAGSGGAARAP